MFVEGFQICHVIQEKWSPSLVAITAVSKSLKMKLTKTRCGSQLTDEHLTSQWRVATTSVIADIDKLYKDSKFQVSH